MKITIIILIFLILSISYVHADSEPEKKDREHVKWLYSLSCGQLENYIKDQANITIYQSASYYTFLFGLLHTKILKGTCEKGYGRKG